MASHTRGAGNLDQIQLRLIMELINDRHFPYDLTKRFVTVYRQGGI